jgi:orotidine-5'-phosphate decarboxylase
VKRIAGSRSRAPNAARSRLIFALDVPTTRAALGLVDLLRKEVGLFKIGKQLFVHAGPEIVRAVQKRGGEVFLDLKFHDIPRTVAAAGVEAARLGVFLFNVHAAGGLAMMRETAREVAKVCRVERLRRPRVVAVTVLTSLDGRDLREVGMGRSVERQVTRLAKLAQTAGLDGVVASPLEIAAIRKHCGARFLVVTPGVRPPQGEMQDQKRVMTPEAAIRAGADYLVVGAPIRDARDPVAAARTIVAAIAEGLLPRRG